MKKRDIIMDMYNTMKEIDNVYDNLQQQSNEKDKSDELFELELETHFQFYETLGDIFGTLHITKTKEKNYD